MNGKLSTRIVILVTVFASAALACAVSVAIPQAAITQPPASTGTPPAAPAASTLTAAPSGTACPHGDCAKACLSQLNSIEQTSGSSETRPKAAGQGPAGARASVLVTYPVNGGQLGAAQYSDHVPAGLSALQHDTREQQDIWNYFTAIIPAGQRAGLVYYILSTDGRGGMLASVEQFSGQSETWALVVDPADAGKPRDLTFTLLHEFGHLLTLEQLTGQAGPGSAPASG